MICSYLSSWFLNFDFEPVKLFYLLHTSISVTAEDEGKNSAWKVAILEEYLKH